ncbi:MAG: 5'/3'-nucleotidase SurE [Spirochaetales bacterium]|nr:5'/3'-nucleotidase SurE [Spirochaetales bacterium]
MKLLLTNDDGYQSEGIKVLAETLARDHEVFIFAPDSERSGMSHAMSLRTPGKVRRRAEREYSCSGTPADCVILAGLGAIPFQPDAVVSGINRGPNLGTDLVYSGTAAAARQASMHGLPGIAVSLATYEPPFEYLPAARFIARHLPELLALWDPEVFVNVNVPPLPADGLPEGVTAYPSRRRYRDKLRSFEAPDGYSYCFLADGKVETDPWDEGDEAAIRAGKAAVSRVLVYPAVPGDFRAGIALG